MNDAKERTEHTPTPFASITTQKGYRNWWFNFRGRSGMMTCNILDSEMPSWKELSDVVNAYESNQEKIRGLEMRLAYYENGTQIKEVHFDEEKLIQAQATIKVLLKALEGMVRSVSMHCQEHGPLPGAVKVNIAKAHEVIAQASQDGGK